MKVESSEAAEREFDALVTMDRGIPHQENLTYMNLVIVLLQARSNRLKDLLAPLADETKTALAQARSGEVVRITTALWSLRFQAGKKAALLSERHPWKLL